MEHGERRMEEIKGNYYLMSECFLGGGKNERWEEFLARIISSRSFFYSQKSSPNDQ